ncbi:MAG: CDP-alcohol phosphatidyltransferase family protein [Patescibacteria group bacterium]
MPPKFELINKSRKVIDLWILRLPLPNINPSLISFLALPFSLAFILLWDKNKLISLILLMIILILDWLDGLVAKKYGRSSERGWLTDVSTDRFSEGIIFLIFITPWFYLFLLNIFLTYFSYKLKKFSLILPLRQLFFIYLVAYHTFYYFIR